MADNLMAKDYTKRNANPGFGYAGGTQDILTAYNGLNHRGASIRYSVEQNLLQQQLEHLYELKRILIQQEDDFFELFGIRDEKSRKNSFKILKDKIESWNATGAVNLINDASKNNIFYKGLGAIKQLAIEAELNEEDWDGLIEQTLQSVDAQELRLILEETDNLAKVMNAIIDSKQKFATGKNSPLARIRVYLDDDKIIIDGDKDNVSLTLQNKLVGKMKKHLGLDKKPQQVKPKYNFEQMFEDLFLQTGINPEGQKYIKMAIRDNFTYTSILNDYAFNSNTSQIKGFLGEIYNNAFLYFMANGDRAKKEALDRITPTGSMRELAGSRPELVIDTWLYGIGIQVKNYEKNKVMRDGFTFRNDMGAGELVTNKLQLESEGTSNWASVGDILLNFFTAYDYNQDYGKTGKLSQEMMASAAYEYWKKTRARMADKIRDQAAFTNILLPYAAQLMGVERSFSTENGLFVKDETYHNTFFNISGNYIPSSVLIQAVIDSVEKKTSKKSFSSLLELQARFKSHELSKYDKWSPDIDNNVVAEIFKNRKKYADSSKVEYTLTLNMDELVNNLLKYID